MIFLKLLPGTVEVVVDKGGHELQFIDRLKLMWGFGQPEICEQERLVRPVEIFLLVPFGEPKSKGKAVDRAEESANGELFETRHRLSLTRKFAVEEGWAPNIRVQDPHDIALLKDLPGPIGDWSMPAKAASAKGIRGACWMLISVQFAVVCVRENAGSTL